MIHERRMQQTLMVPRLFLLLSIVGAADVSTEQVVPRVGNAFARGGFSHCKSLTNRYTNQFTLGVEDLTNNCVLVPGSSADIYRLVIKGDYPDMYLFDLMEIHEDGYKITPETWDETVQGMEYCAPGGSILYFDNSEKKSDKHIAISTIWLSAATDDYCCVNQPISWSYGKARCPSTIEANDPRVCWSTSKYYFQADHMDYRIARPDPIPDTVVAWQNRSIAKNCASVYVAEGEPYIESTTKQTISTTFTSMNAGGENCVFMEGELLE